MKLLYHLTAAIAALQCVSAAAIGGRPGAIIKDDPEKRALLQNIVSSIGRVSLRKIDSWY